MGEKVQCINCSCSYREVCLLHGIKDDDWNEAKGKDRRDCRNNSDSADHVEESLQVGSQSRRQLLIDRVNILAESIDNATHWCNVKERHWCAEHHEE